jgi:choline dehydrogenase-like flavoprotein
MISSTAALRLPIFTPTQSLAAAPATPASADRADANDSSCLTRHERALLSKVAETALPAGTRLRRAGVWTATKLDAFFAGMPSVVRAGFRATLWALETSAWATRRRSFTQLGEEERGQLLDEWHNGTTPLRLALRMLLVPLKIAHFNDRSVYEELGCVFREDPSTAARSESRGVIDGNHVDADETIDCDVVVVGTGAGGAVVAKELAEKGFAVVLVEEGEKIERTQFTGHSVTLQKKLYRDMGATFALGNAPLLLPVGRAVGGTTTINAGTCFRTPPSVLERWRSEAGLAALTDERMAQYYARVEGVLGVARSRKEHLGGIARVIARGADALGYHHSPLDRNAPDCEGKGSCFFGCPTDAKRSTNVSYVPLALRAGARLYTSTRVERLLVSGGRAVGVEARTGAGARLRVNARAVTVAAGALFTPLLLQRSGIGARSGQLGRNLSVHPAGGVGAMFDEPVRGWDAIPQGYSVDEFKHEGILFEGAFMPPDLGAAALPFFGRKLVDVVEQYDRFACFGYMISDQSRGRVRPGPGGRPLITYVVEKSDVLKVRRAVAILARIYFAAGARVVFPFVAGHDELRSLEEVDAFERAPLRARDFDLTGYHPLGTARAGADPRRSVVGPDLQAHDCRGLYVTDGSAVPTALGVNPQVTIMALATHGADAIASALG